MVPYAMPWRGTILQPIEYASRHLLANPVRIQICPLASDHSVRPSSRPDNSKRGVGVRLAIYAILALAGILGAASDAVLNQWARNGRLGWLLAAYVSWLVVATLVGMILRMGYFGFGAAVVLFLLVNSVGAIILDRVLFGGRLSLMGWVGIGLAFAAIVCIELGRDHSATSTAGRQPSSGRTSTPP
jgi:multidrug transporter EmrE-like cation transporter